jgi:hypothetical protein
MAAAVPQQVVQDPAFRRWLLNEDEEVYVTLFHDSPYLSTQQRCDVEYHTELQNFLRTAGNYNIQMYSEDVDPQLVDENIWFDANTNPAGHSTGRERLDSLLMAAQIVNENKFTFSERQVFMIYDTYFVASLQKIFGDELSANIDHILKTFNIVELFEDVLIMMKRRGGKTIGTAVYVACFAMTQLRGNINVFGKSKRVTKMMKEVVKEIYLELKASGRFEPTKILTDNDEQLSIQTKYGNVNTINFYPCNSEVRS